MAQEDPKDPTNKYCIFGEHWTREWRLKQHYCDICWNIYLRKQKYVRKRKPLLMRLQGNQCAICERPFEELRMSSIHVDHDHTEAFRVRGILCINCNSMIGHAKDNIETLRRAIIYLEGPPGVPVDDLLKKPDYEQKTLEPERDFFSLFEESDE